MHLRLLVRKRCIIHKWQTLQRLLYFIPTLSPSKLVHVVHCLIFNPTASQRWLLFFSIPSLFRFYKHYHPFHLQKKKKKQQILYLGTLCCKFICCILLCHCHLSQFSHTVTGMTVRVRCEMAVVSEVN